MNTNTRGTRSTSDKQSYKNSAIGTRHSSISTPNNNIHININLNVKKKSQCIIHGGEVGKKINNFVQVNRNEVSEEGEKHSQELVKSTAVGKAKFLTTTTNKKSQTDKKTKKKINKEKQKTASKPFTPEKEQKKQSEEKSFQKSKTGKKLAKKKQSKSMENLKIFKQKHSQQDNRKLFDLTVNNKDSNKFKSKSNSNSKQRSREKSATKLKKNRASSKNIVAFQNSGIKKVLGTERQTATKNEGLQHLRKSKKSLKINKNTEKDIIKINEFMQEKKKKKQSAEDSTTKGGVRIKDESMKVSKQKREFFSKPERKQKDGYNGKNSRHPIYFGDDEDDSNKELEDERFFVMNEQKSSNNFSTHKTPEKSRVQSVRMSPQAGHITKKSSAKKKKRTTKQSLIQKYKHGKLTPSEYTKFITKIVMIQANWRGYTSRKKLVEEIWRMNRMIQERRRLINQKREEFWDDDENNSITNLEVEGGREKGLNHRNSENLPLEMNKTYRTPQGSDYNSSSIPTDEIHTNNKKYESQSGYSKEQLEQQSQLKHHEQRINIYQFKKNVIELKKGNQQQRRKEERIQSDDNHSNDNDQTIDNNKNPTISNTFLMSQIQQLKRQLQQQNKKFTQLQKENSQLKENLISKVEVEKKKDYNNKEKGFKKHLQIKTDQEELAKKPLEYQIIGNSSLTDISFTNKNETKSPSSLYVESLKKQLVSSQFESPSNRALLKSPKSQQSMYNLQRAFKKKQLSIDMTYEKNSIIYKEMLQNNVVSPKTYNFKRLELDERYKRQKEEISSKFQQAEKVMKYIREEINVVQEEEDGEDESPKKTKEIKSQMNMSIDISSNEIKANNQKHYPQQQQTIHQQQQHYQQPSPTILIESNSSTQSNFRKYWTDDIDEVHKKVLEISSKIDQALLTDSKGEQQEKREQQSAYDSIQQQQQVIMPNISTLSNTSNTSGRNLDAYNIHYPSSPSSNNSNVHKQQKHYKFVLEESGNQLLQDQNEKQQQQQYQEEEDEEQQTTQCNNDQQLSQQNKSFISQSNHSMKSSQTIQKTQQKGFDTRLTFIKQYCIALCQFIRSQNDLKEKFVQNISTPLKYNYFEYLKAYRTTMQKSQNDTKYNSTVEDYMYPYFRLVHGPVIEKGLNTQNTTRFDELYNQSYGVTKELTQQTIEMRKFFIQAIIDVFNESLDFQRPGSIYGEPLPWFAQAKNLKNNHVKYLKEDGLRLRHRLSGSDGSTKNDDNNDSSQILNEDNDQDQKLDKIFGIAIAKIIQWGSCLCGFIPEPVSFDGEEAQAVNIDEEQTNLVRETRLAYMLEKSLAQEEERMVDHTKEQLEVQLQIQQLIYCQLAEECANQLLEINNKRLRLLN